MVDLVKLAPLIHLITDERIGQTSKRVVVTDDLTIAHMTVTKLQTVSILPAKIADTTRKDCYEDAPNN